MIGGTFSGLGGGILAVGIVATLVGGGMFFAALLDEQSNQDEERDCGLFGCRGGPDEGRSQLNWGLSEAGWSIGGFGLICLLTGGLFLGMGRGVSREEDHAMRLRESKP